MNFEFKSSNFLSNPTPLDKRIRIYDKNKNLRYNIKPYISYFYNKNNCITIKIVDNNDINLIFENKSDANLAMTKLLSVMANFFDKSPNINSLTYSLKNFNMEASYTINNGDMACDNPVLDIPKSTIRVLVNGLDVDVGSPISDNNICMCFFAPYSSTGQTLSNARMRGSEQKGDYLYWIGNNSWSGTTGGQGAGYELAPSDFIDFVYLTLT